MLRASLAVLIVCASISAQSPSTKVDLNGDPLPDRAIARIGSVRFRHPGPLQAVAFSPDGKLVAAASALPSVVRIWDRANGKLLDQWRFPEQAPPEQLLFSPDSRYLLAGRFSERAKPWSVWDVAGRAGIDVGPEGERSIPFQTLAPDGRHATSRPGSNPLLGLGDG
jgi:WD40 repeat protein